MNDGRELPCVVQGCERPAALPFSPAWCQECADAQEARVAGFMEELLRKDRP